jgi:hypothetical protein
MILLVCGGRDYNDVATAHRILSATHALKPITLLIHGAARGADNIAADWAHANGVQTQPFPARWDRYGKKAGPMRNTQMLIEGKPDSVLAFPGGVGTANMIKQATQRGLSVVMVLAEPIQALP